MSKKVYTHEDVQIMLAKTQEYYNTAMVVAGLDQGDIINVQTYVAMLYARDIGNTPPGETPALFSE